MLIIAGSLEINVEIPDSFYKRNFETRVTVCDGMGAVREELLSPSPSGSAVVTPFTSCC